MKQFKVVYSDEIFPGSVIVNNRAFKMVNTRDKSAHFQDCFECLSPHDLAA